MARPGTATWQSPLGLAPNAAKWLKSPEGSFSAVTLLRTLCPAIRQPANRHSWLGLTCETGKLLDRQVALHAVDEHLAGKRAVSGRSNPAVAVWKHVSVVDDGSHIACRWLQACAQQLQQEEA